MNSVPRTLLSIDCLPNIYLATIGPAGATILGHHPECGEVTGPGVRLDTRLHITICKCKKTNNPKSSFNVYTSHDRYHTYGLKWDATTLIWYVDGKEVGRYAKSTNQSQLNQGQWPFDKHFHVILNQSVGNNAWAADADVTHTYETRFDWVRVYQTPGMENTNGTVGVVDVREEDRANVQVVDNAVVVTVDSPRNVAVYDVAGRKVAEAFVGTTHSFALPCGVYLAEGEKVLVK